MRTAHDRARTLLIALHDLRDEARAMRLIECEINAAVEDAVRAARHAAAVEAGRLGGLARAQAQAASHKPLRNE